MLKPSYSVVVKIEVEGFVNGELFMGRSIDDARSAWIIDLAAQGISSRFTLKESQ
jgi:predicted methyltransferase